MIGEGEKEKEEIGKKAMKDLLEVLQETKELQVISEVFVAITSFLQYNSVCSMQPPCFLLHLFHGHISFLIFQFVVFERVFYSFILG
jgi:hypothetical protein